jgi:5-methylcytosine-specific restriction endonuclease McrA
MTAANYKLACKRCNATFTTTYKHRIYCSGACKLKAFKAANPDKVQAYRLADLARKKAKPKPKPKSENIVRMFAHVSEWKAYKRKLAAQENKNMLAKIPCQHCGKKVGYAFGAPRKFCSQKCKNKIVKQRPEVKEANKARRQKRKAIQRGAKAGATFTYKQVFERDGWRCQLCSKVTPERKRGTISHNAPEVDHIIPLSKGGEHSLNNAQTLCRACNGWKSDKIIPAQQGLFTALVGAL